MSSDRDTDILIGKFVNIRRSIISPPPTLGVLLRKLRARHGWTLKQMSENSGIPLSTLSKIEHDRLTLTYDKLYQVSQRLGIPISELFAETGEERTPAVTARRSLGDVGQALHVETHNYDYFFLCTELRRKRMIPVITKIRAKTLKEFGELVHHPGEEFIYVLSGSIIVNTEFYDPVVLQAGQSIYIDSTMGHAYLAASDCDEAEVLGVMSNSGDDLQESLMSIHDGHRSNRAQRSSSEVHA